jgi:hypothetical protein
LDPLRRRARGVVVVHRGQGEESFELLTHRLQPLLETLGLRLIGADDVKPYRFGGAVQLRVDIFGREYRRLARIDDFLQRRVDAAQTAPSHHRNGRREAGGDEKHAENLVTDFKIV